jgi:two-component system, NarL family, sensor histidine kinase DegS
MTEILLNTLEDERRYVARELHDGVAQSTLQLGLQAGICRKMLERGSLDMLATELAELEKRIQTASGQVREVIADLRPPQIEPEAALDEYIQRAIDVHLGRGGAPVECRFEQADFPTLSTQQRLAVYRVVQEALLNIRKHAGAKNVRLAMADNGKTIILVIADNGKGFDTEQIKTRPVNKGGAGLANLHVRAQVIGGAVSIARDATGQWTEVTITFPKH